MLRVRVSRASCRAVAWVDSQERYNAEEGAGACKAWEGESAYQMARPRPRQRRPRPRVWLHELWTFSGFSFPSSGDRNGNRGIALDVPPSSPQPPVQTVA